MEHFTETEQFLHFAYPDNPILELRAFMPLGPQSGRYDDYAIMARHAIALQARHGARAVYYALNAIRPDAHVGASQVNTFAPRPQRGSGASAAKIAGRSLYLIDCDSVHPQGVMATESEHQAAMDVADRVQTWLTSQGWPEPIKVDSGNGCHLLYRGDGCPADFPCWTFILHRLSERFTTHKVKIDECVYDAARISRLPGGWNRKGEDTPERPHRQSHVTSYPSEWVPVGYHLIFDLATDLGMDTDSEVSVGIKGTEDQVLALIDEYPDYLSLKESHQSGDNTILTLDECPFVGRPHAGGPSAIIIHGDGGIGYKCFADSCPGKGFGSLLGLLQRLTGRKSKAFPGGRAPITPDDYRHWGMDDLAEALEDEEGSEDDPGDENDLAEDDEEEPEPVEPVTPIALVPTPISPAQAITAPAPVDDDEDGVKAFVRSRQPYNPEHLCPEVRQVNWGECPLSLDPADWGLDYDDLEYTWWRLIRKDAERVDDAAEHEALRLRSLHTLYDRDTVAMGWRLGYKWLATISLHKESRPVEDKNKPLTVAEFKGLMSFYDLPAPAPKRLTVDEMRALLAS